MSKNFTTEARRARSFCILLYLGVLHVSVFFSFWFWLGQVRS